MLTLAPLFADHAVLQQGRPLPVWGRARPGAAVSVRLAGASAETVADGAGAFCAVLPAVAAGGPFALVVAGAGETVSCADVMVGEVWLCSGQSNMEWSMQATPDCAEEIPRAEHALIRLTTVPSVLPARPASPWVACTPATAAGFSAVAIGLGREIQRRTGHAVGLIAAAWGGTRIDAWTPAEALAGDEDGRAVLAAYAARAQAPEARAQSAAWRPFSWAEWEEANRARDPGDLGSPRGWAEPGHDDGGWPTMTLPSVWQDQGIRGSAVVWFRRAVEIPAAWRGRDLMLHLGACDKHDTTFVNGERVGGIGFENVNAWCTPRIYRIPGRLVTGTRLVIAARVFSFLYNGGMTGPAALMRVECPGEAEAVPLAGAWRYRIEHDFGFIQPPPPAPPGPFDPDRPGGLWEAKIAPLAPFAVAGFAWYQGESDVQQAERYHQRFVRMIRAWRAAWGWAVPFAFVQIASFGSKLDTAGGSPWAELRAAQAETLGEPGTAMATAIDLGDRFNIHPGGKLEVGRRLAAAALHAAGMGADPNGPRAVAAVVEGASVVVRFSGGGGLALRDGGGGFEIAGADGSFVAAHAEVTGDAVVVRAEEVAAPRAVRYAWADVPELGLWGGNGGPALPFRFMLAGQAAEPAQAQAGRS
jgi:sialate O-acetylesterase